MKLSSCQNQRTKWWIFRQAAANDTRVGPFTLVNPKVTMVVSIPKWLTLTWMLWGYPQFRKPPYICACGLCAHNVYIYRYRYTHRLIHIHDSSLKVGGAPFFTPNLGGQIPASRRARSSKGHTMCVAQGEPVAASPTKYGLNGQNTRDGDGLSP